MHLTGIKLSDIPPFTDPITLRFNERVNVFIGPNASGKSTILQILAERLKASFDDSKRSLGDAVYHIMQVNDDEFDEFAEDMRGHGSGGVLSANEDWSVNYAEAPPVIHIGSVREGLPGISDQDSPDYYGDTAAKALDGPFSGSRTMCASELLGKELTSLGDKLRRDGHEAPYSKAVVLGYAIELADACSKQICDEVVRDSKSHNFIPGRDIRDWLSHPRADLNRITVLRLMGINTTDIRNFNDLPLEEQPSLSAYREDADSLPIYLGHLSSGTEGTLLWIRWLALKMVHHYNFDGGSERYPEEFRSFKDSWDKKPAILLIDEIENHLHPTWQRRVIPALLDHFPGLQIFATTHSPFVVAGLRAGQVHVLQRDENGVVTASTEQRDVIGWTADEILRGMMGVEEPTDQLTVDRANRLRELREKEILTPEEETELNNLRWQVNEDLLKKGGPLESQRERYADLMEKFLRSRMSDLGQEGE